MKKLPVMLLLLLPLVSQAAEPGYTDGGREVQLNEDGTWSYATEDIFATTADGTRVRLKTDGSWEAADNTGAPVPAASNALNQASFEELQFVIDDAAIETTTSSGPGGKNSRKHTETTFSILALLSYDAETGREFSVDERLIEVSDTAGREYDIMTLTADSHHVEPGGQIRIDLRVDGSPTWKWGKSYRVTVNGAITDSGRDVVLSIPTSQARDIRIR